MTAMNLQTMKNIELPSPETVKASQVEPLLYDIQQSAQVLNCSTKSIRRLIWRGKLKPCNALRKILIPRRQLEDFVKSSCGNPNPAL